MIDFANDKEKAIMDLDSPLFIQEALQTYYGKKIQSIEPYFAHLDLFGLGPSEITFKPNTGNIFVGYVEGNPGNGTGLGVDLITPKSNGTEITWKFFMDDLRLVSYLPGTWLIARKISIFETVPSGSGQVQLRGHKVKFQ